MMTDDEKLEALAASGRMSGSAPAPVDDEPEDTPPAPPVDDTPPADQPPTPPAPNPADDDGDKDKNQPPQDGNNNLPPPPPSSEPSKPRNVRHIPIAQYQDEKKDWETKLKTVTDELAAAKTGNQPPAAKTEEAEKIIKDFAEKNGIAEDDVRKLLSINTGPAMPEGFVETMQSMQREKAEREEKDFFNQEWTPLEAQLKAKYPNATPDQLKQARELVDASAHTEANINLALKYIVYDADTDIAKIMGTAAAPAPANPAPAPRKSVEHSRPAGSKTSLSASDFKDRKDFAEFNAMDPNDVKAIIKEMDPKTYRNFITWTASEQSQGGVVVQRNGQRVILK